MCCLDRNQGFCFLGTLAWLECLRKGRIFNEHLLSLKIMLKTSNVDWDKLYHRFSRFDRLWLISEPPWCSATRSTNHRLVTKTGIWTVKWTSWRPGWASLHQTNELKACGWHDGALMCHECSTQAPPPQVSGGKTVKTPVISLFRWEKSNDIISRDAGTHFHTSSVMPCIFQTWKLLIVSVKTFQRKHEMIYTLLFSDLTEVR